MDDAAFGCGTLGIPSADPTMTVMFVLTDVQFSIIAICILMGLIAALVLLVDNLADWEQRRRKEKNDARKGK